MPKGVPNKKYTAEFKKMVIETMIEEKLGYSETARKFDVCDYHRIQNWERIYLEEGKDQMLFLLNAEAEKVQGVLLNFLKTLKKIY